MSALEIWLIAVSLAIDCLSVSVTSGIILKRFAWKTFLTMAFFFGLFQGMMALLGWAGANSFSGYIEAYDHWIAFALLALVGGNMIKENFSKEEERHFNPTRLKIILLLAIATSIDSLAVGISFAFMGEYHHLSTILFPIWAFGIVSFIFSISGSVLGAYLGRHVKLNMELWGGVVLIIIGVKILIEHLQLL
jgi:putative Mn2+ efflux pump MntP